MGELAGFSFPPLITNVFIALSTKLLNFLRALITRIMKRIFLRMFHQHQNSTEVTRDTKTTRETRLPALATFSQPVHFTPFRVEHRQMNVTEKQVEMMDIEERNMNKHSGEQGRYGSAGA